ncbi:MAG: hypothetical protein N4J56_003156 [Chroococcidiopsis sp. SAG 2025]|uniref:hypothetical protein n=1 Tax=Chroococcidiopsis sp. SAG 2025 TaxID=171389 RepID=UPI00293742E7|nr:hypothetical protein [Chroococcidiopsis sp. SAG 2025]MDV2993502.1 hypothetical protein [Chroococcidiopsis sp. SAG 2025]
MSRSKIVIKQIVSQDGEATTEVKESVEVKEDVSEASSSAGDNTLEVAVKNGKAHIRSNGFKVVKKEIKSQKGNSISIEATSSGKGATKVSVTTSTSDTNVSEVLDGVSEILNKGVDKLDNLFDDLDDW